MAPGGLNGAVGVDFLYVGIVDECHCALHVNRGLFGEFCFLPNSRQIRKGGSLCDFMFFRGNFILRYWDLIACVCTSRHQRKTSKVFFRLLR